MVAFVISHNLADEKANRRIYGSAEDRPTDGLTDQRPDGMTDQRTDGATARRTDGPTERRTDGLTDRRSDDTTERRTDGRALFENRFVETEGGNLFTFSFMYREYSRCSRRGIDPRTSASKASPLCIYLFTKKKIQQFEEKNLK